MTPVSSIVALTVSALFLSLCGPPSQLEAEPCIGYEIDQNHRVLEFRRSLRLKAYIDFNTDERNHAGNNFEKDFYKLMNNSV